MENYVSYSLGKYMFIICFTLSNLLLGSPPSPLCYGFDVNPIVQALEGCSYVVFHDVRFDLVVTQSVTVSPSSVGGLSRPTMGSEISMVVICVLKIAWIGPHDGETQFWSLGRVS